jgi:hypothetical protein
MRRKNSKFETISNYQNSNDPNKIIKELISIIIIVLNIGLFGFRICFVFRDSYFEFPEWCFFEFNFFIHDNNMDRKPKHQNFTALNFFICSVMATSVGRRSMLEAP